MERNEARSSKPPRDWFILASLLAAAGLVVLFVRARTMRSPSTPGKASEFRGFSLDAIAPFYDPFIHLLGFGAQSRRRSVELAGIKPGDRVLDVGCGTGELTLYEKDAAGPAAYVAGIDVGPRLIEIAKGKARQTGRAIDFRVASIESLPFPDGSFDVVTSSLMLHHLPTETKRTGLAEVYRVLKPGGRILILDIGPTTVPLRLITGPLARVLSFVPELVYSQDNFEGRVPDFLREAGFAAVQSLAKHRFLGLSLEVLLARKPYEMVAQ